MASSRTFQVFSVERCITELCTKWGRHNARAVRHIANCMHAWVPVSKLHRKARMVCNHLTPILRVHFHRVLERLDLELQPQQTTVKLTACKCGCCPCGGKLAASACKLCGSKTAQNSKLAKMHLLQLGVCLLQMSRCVGTRYEQLLSVQPGYGRYLAVSLALCRHGWGSRGPPGFWASKV